ncbi:MAG TPA: enoyl-CoA hydratase, partial [Bradyrhizobium sp.]|nr:enoyl-CoA hydratase [Bradyrhizobium sp.]
MQATGPAPQATSSPIVLRENSGGIALLTLNRPALRNTLSEPMMAALGEALAAIAPDPQVR